MIRTFHTLAFTAVLVCAPALSAQTAVSDIYRSVLRIEVATQIPDYETPWNSGRFSGGIGTGFIIGKNRILTNAHVVSNARRLLITVHGSPVKYPARVEHIAHDCDLALLSVEDFKDFEDFPTFEFGDVPALESQVRVIGYPIGGERLSVTRGVVSRIDFQPYSHSRADSHLAVQIDAAINPGNSGGPVIQDDKVVGVAFQGLRQADNTGYIIPTPVVRRFLKDVEDGKYDQYVDLGFSEFPLHNPAMRKALGLEDDGKGVLVTNVVPTSSSDGILNRATSSSNSTATGRQRGHGFHRRRKNQSQRDRRAQVRRRQGGGALPARWRMERRGDRTQAAAMVAHVCHRV
jgi:S1-C subfamily serine protease